LQEAALWLSKAQLHVMTIHGSIPGQNCLIDPGLDGERLGNLV